jgi:hypothetical protein
MPFVCIELPNKAPRDAVSHLRESIRTAFGEHLATKDHKYDFVMIHEGSVSAEDVMVGLTVDLRPGRTDHQKQAFVDASCNAIRQCLGIKPDMRTYVLCFERSSPPTISAEASRSAHMCRRNNEISKRQIWTYPSIRRFAYAKMTDLFL